MVWAAVMAAVSAAAVGREEESAAILAAAAGRAAESAAILAAAASRAAESAATLATAAATACRCRSLCRVGAGIGARRRWRSRLRRPVSKAKGKCVEPSPFTWPFDEAAPPDGRDEFKPAPSCPNRAGASNEVTWRPHWCVAEKHRKVLSRNGYGKVFECPSTFGEWRYRMTHVKGRSVKPMSC